MSLPGIISITYPVDDEMFRGSTSIDGAQQRHETVRMKSVRSETNRHSVLNFIVFKIQGLIKLGKTFLVHNYLN